MYTSIVNIDFIQVLSQRYLSTLPSEKKMNQKRNAYKKDKKLHIIIREGTNELLDGFAYYLLAKELKLSQVECTIIEKNETFLAPTTGKDTGYRIKNDLFINNNYKCYICELPVSLDVEQDSINFATIDHIFPRALGGVGVIKNLQCCCRFCNNTKGDQILTPNLKKKILIEKHMAIKNGIKTVKEYKEYIKMNVG